MASKHSKCAQILIAGHIVIKLCLLLQCVHHVPAGYLPPCPQCGVLVEDIGAGMRVPSLISARDRNLVNTIGVLGDSRHDEMMRSGLKEARFVGFGRRADDELSP